MKGGIIEYDRMECFIAGVMSQDGNQSDRFVWLRLGSFVLFTAGGSIRGFEKWPRIFMGKVGDDAGWTVL